MNSKNISNCFEILLDVIFTVLIQIIIVFLIILVPSIIVLFIKIGMNDNPTFVMNIISYSMMNDIISNSAVIKVALAISVPFSYYFAPKIYEKVRNDETFKDKYKIELKENIRYLLKGILFGAIAFLLVFAIMLFTKNIKIRFLNITIVDIIVILMMFCVILMTIISEELLIRKYIKIKTEQVASPIFFWIVSNVLFAFIALKQADSVNLIYIINIVLISCLLSLFFKKNNNIYTGVGIRTMYVFLSYLIFNIKALNFEGINIFETSIENYITARTSGLLDNYAVTVVVVIGILATMINNKILCTEMKK